MSSNLRGISKNNKDLIRLSLTDSQKLQETTQVKSHTTDVCKKNIIGQESIVNPSSRLEVDYLLRKMGEGIDLQNEL